MTENIIRYAALPGRYIQLHDKARQQQEPLDKAIQETRNSTYSALGCVWEAVTRIEGFRQLFDEGTIDLKELQDIVAVLHDAADFAHTAQGTYSQLETEVNAMYSDLHALLEAVQDER